MTVPGEDVRHELTQAGLVDLLCDEAWEGRWRPLDHTNVRPVAQHTARMLYEAGFVVIERPTSTVKYPIIPGETEALVMGIGSPPRPGQRRRRWRHLLHPGRSET